MIKTYLKTVKNKKLRKYPYRYLKGLVGLVKGLYLYSKNKRDVDKKAYVNYFIVKEITGKENWGE